jgi:hypothetical protein
MSTDIVPLDFDLELKHLSATICAELAAGLADVDGVKRKYDIGDSQWDLLKKSPMFRNMLREALGKFSGDMNAGKRITVKAEIALEDSIPAVYSMVHDREIPSATRLDSVKTLAMLAGRTQKTAENGGGGGGGGSSGVSINIKIQTGENDSGAFVIEGESSPSAG